jgi:UDP-glucose 4-epimerase
MRVLVTGATGFVGAQVLERLTARGDTVRMLVRPDTLARQSEHKDLREWDNVEMVAGGLADADILAQATQGMEVVYHLAALLPRPGVQPRSLIRTNVQGTQNLLEACVTGKVRRIVFTSSAIIYGPARIQVTEEDPVKAQGVYGQTKIEAENLIRRYHRMYGLEYVILRLAPVYGPGMPYFEWLLKRILSFPRLTLWHGGEQVIQWVHVRDVADAVIVAGTRPEAVNSTFTIAGNEAVMRPDLIALVHDVAGRGRHAKAFSVRSHRRWTAPVKYDIRKAKALLGFTPKVPLEDGLAEMLAALDRPRRATH